VDLYLLAGSLALGAWTVWLIRRGRLPRWAYPGAAIAVILIPGTAYITAALLVGTFQDVQHANASERQRALSEGISRAMTPTLVGVSLLVIWLVLLLVISLRANRRDVT
jgi:hypothetical protein